MAHAQPQVVVANVKTAAISTAQHQAADGKVETQKMQSPASLEANQCKNGAPTSTCNRISFASGSETLQHTDFSLPGPFPIVWTRTYHSRLDALDSASLGARWITEFTTCIDVLDDGVLFHDVDGRSHAYPLPKIGMSHYDPVEYNALVRTTDSQLILMRGLGRKETYERAGGASSSRISCCAVAQEPRCITSTVIRAPGTLGHQHLPGE